MTHPFSRTETRIFAKGPRKAGGRPAKGRIAWKGKCSSMALKPLFGYPKHCELSAMEQAYHNARKEHLWFFCKRERTAKGRRYKLKKKSFVGQPPYVRRSTSSGHPSSGPSPPEAAICWAWQQRNHRPGSPVRCRLGAGESESLDYFCGF